MSDEGGPRKPNESFLVGGGAQEELQRVYAINGARGETFFGLWLDGLTMLNARLRRGDPEAREVIERLDQQLETARRLLKLVAPPRPPATGGSS